jgi:Putative zinc-finger
MSCENFEHLIALDAAGDLAAGERAQVRAHLAGCAPCREFAAELAADLQWLREAHREPADGAALERVRASVMRRLECEQARRNRPFGGLLALGWRWRWVAVSAAVSVLLGGVAWWARPAAPPNIAVAVDTSGGNKQRPADGAPQEPARSSGARAAAPRAASRRPAVARETAPAVAAPTTADAAAPAAVRKNERQELARTNRIEVVTAILPPSESQQAPSEAVMLKMPSGNPDITVYWLMDDANPAPGANRETPENQGD